MQQNYLWTQIHSQLKEQPIHLLKLKKMGKQVHEVFIGCFSEYLVRFKDSRFTQQHKRFDLDFTSKFEVIRTEPKMKPERQKQSKIRGEDILELGRIVSIKLHVENYERTYELTGEFDQLIILRQFLGSKINQLGFHNMFKVYKKIGRGNFASVYLGQRIEDNLKMAVKAFSKQSVYGEEKGREGLINEIQTMRALDHPNLMKMYEVYETDNSIYMGLELLEGDQLFEHLRKKTHFTQEQIKQIIQGLLEGLKHMHNKGIMHRDLKLENILFKKQGIASSVVIADFGLAQQVSQKPYLYSRCGTPGFVAPEIINLKNLYSTYDSVCDIYSLGLIFYILLCGKPAFTGKTYNTIVEQNKLAHINLDLISLDLIPGAKSLLKKMLEKDPTRRVKASEALQHYFFHPMSEEDEFNISTDDNPNLQERLNKLNVQAQKLDMCRLKSMSPSVEKSPMLTPCTQELKDIQTESGFEVHLVMRTPVITGRVISVERDSPKFQFQSSPHRMELEQELEVDHIVLNKYTQKSNQ